MPQLVKPDNLICKEFQLGKMTTSFKSKSFSSENILDLVHNDLCGPMRTRSFQGDRYFMIFTDDYSRMMWVTFLKEKFEAFNKFKAFKALVEKETGKNLKCLRSDRGGEFTSTKFVKYCDEHGIKRQISAPRTPQQNGVTKRRNWTTVEAARTMLIQGDVPKFFWREAVSTIVYTMNQVLVKKGNDKTPYELWHGHTPNVSYFKVFGNKYIERDEYIGKFDSKSDERTFLGYSTKSKAFKCFNKRTKKIVETVNVKVDEYSYKSDDTNKYSAVEKQRIVIIEPNIQIDAEQNKKEDIAQPVDEEDEDEEQEETSIEKSVIPRYVKLNHLAYQIIGDKNIGVQTRRKIRESSCLIPTIESKTVRESLKDDDWIKAMNEELDQIEKNNTRPLVPKPTDKNVIRTKWVFRNKFNKDGEVVRNKARLVCKGYAQEKGEDYGETFAPVARLKGVRILLAFATFKGFKVYQKDVKSAFLNGILEEEVYIEQPDGFALTKDKNMVCKLHKALYGLNQAPRAWYERLHSHLIKIGFQRTSEDKNIYLNTKRDKL